MRRAQSLRYIYLHPWCHTCRKQARGEHVKHPLYTPAMDRYWQQRAGALGGNASSRNLVVAIDKDDVLGLFLKQDGRCALTGIEMRYSHNYRGNSRFLASIDRIDSDGNYTLDNIQIVCAVVNTMKSNLTGREFIEMCQAVVDYRHKTSQELLEAIAC